MRKEAFRRAAAGTLAVAAVALPAVADIPAGTFTGPTNTGPSSTQTPYIVPINSGVRTVSVLTTNDAVTSIDNPANPYTMAGTPDGLGYYDNGDGTFQLFMNHEFTTAQGGPRSHGNALGSFVSEYKVSKTTLGISGGRDLIRNVVNGATPVTGAALNFNRFCSADLPAASAYSFDPTPAAPNSGDELGTAARLYMNGEETTGGRAFANVASGPNKGTSYQLPLFGAYAWENLLANPAPGAKTLVIGNDDGSGGGGTAAARGLLVVYQGTKQSATGAGLTEADKAGLTNGTAMFIQANGLANSESQATGVGTAKGASAPFTLVNTPAQATAFLRPEDGAWDPQNPKDYYFVTTDTYDQVKDGVGPAVGRSRLWRMSFSNISNPTAGGQVTMLLDGTEAHNMFDNITIDKHGHIVLLEDVGNQAHNGKIWGYDIASGNLSLLGKHDPARFGDIGQAATAPFNVDEETSGVIDAEDVLGRNWFLLVDQAHYPNTAIPTNVEGGQLIALYAPDAAFVPEPGSASLLLIGAGGLVARRRRR